MRCLINHLPFWLHLLTFLSLLPALAWPLNSSQNPSLIFFQNDAHVSASKCWFLLFLLPYILLSTHPFGWFNHLFQDSCKCYHLEELFPGYKRALSSTSCHSLSLYPFFMLRAHHFLTNSMPICFNFVIYLPLICTRI